MAFIITFLMSIYAGYASVLMSVHLDNVSCVSYNQDTAVIAWRIMISSVVPWIVLIMIIVCFIAYGYGQKRREDLQRFARQTGLAFSSGSDIDADEELNDFLLFSDYSVKKLSNVIRGEMDGVLVMMFDYRSTTGVGQVASTRSQSVAIMELHRLKPPSFEMYPQDIFRRVFGPLSKKKGIEFPHRSGFSEAYVLISEDENAVRKVFTDTVLSYFENHKGLTVEVKGERLLYYRNGRMIRPEEAGSFLQQGLDIIRLFQ